MERGGMGRAERWEGKGREEKGREGGGRFDPPLFFTLRSPVYNNKP